MVSSAHNVCPKGYYIAIVSTIAEGDSNHHLELQPGLDRLGKIEELFMGAQGTLGIVTQATLELVKRPAGLEFDTRLCEPCTTLSIVPSHNRAPSRSARGGGRRARAWRADGHRG